MKRRFWIVFVLLCLIVAGYGWFWRHARPVKNIILMIGDGMGPQQISLLLQYAKQAPDAAAVPDRTLSLERLIAAGETGMMSTYPKDNLVIDSAASATHLATGEFTRTEMVGLNRNGFFAETLLEKARRLGKSTGLVTDTRVTHATPAAFAAHQMHRSMENEIAEDILKTQPDVILGGGLRHWLPADDPRSKRKDHRDLIQEARSLGYGVVTTKQEMFQSNGPMILGLFSNSLMPDAIEMHQNRNNSDFPVPSLKEMTKTALETLSRNKKGFFLMVEGGLIDYAGHFNDAGWMLHELLAFDETIGRVYEWAKNRDDTLVVVTADHETGSFGLSYSKYHIPSAQKLSSGQYHQPRFNFGSARMLDGLYQQKKSFMRILYEFDHLSAHLRTSRHLQKFINDASVFKISRRDAEAVLATEPNRFYVKGHEYLSDSIEPRIHDFKEYYVYGSENRAALIARAMAREQQVVWGTGTHTSTPVPLFVLGPKKVTRKFDGLLHAREVGRLLQGVMNP